jgi:hypothetical protein
MYNNEPVGLSASAQPTCWLSGARSKNGDAANVADFQTSETNQPTPGAEARRRVGVDHNRIHPGVPFHPPVGALEPFHRVSSRHPPGFSPGVWANHSRDSRAAVSLPRRAMILPGGGVDGRFEPVHRPVPSPSHTPHRMAVFRACPMPPANEPPRLSPASARARLRALLLEGAASAPDRPADAAYFQALRRRIDDTPAPPATP